jgi:sugar diacid utilization regulator
MGIDELTDEDIAVIRCLASSDMNVGRTARAMNYSRYSIVYHMNRVEQKTGYNPRVFYDLVELLRWLR